MAAVKHAFTSAKGDGADATLVRPSDWNANHTGNSTFGITVASSVSSSTKDQGAADYVCDNTADDVQLQQAIDDLETAGGGTLTIAEGTYTLAAGLLVDTNVRIRIIGYGAKLNLPASVSGIKIKQGNTTTRGVRIEGLIVDGQSNASTVGVEFEDTNNPELVKVDIENCTTGLLFDSQAASAFVEGAYLRDVIIRSCTTGWASSVTSGTGSFAQTDARGVRITGATTGISFVNTSIFQRSHIEATVWIGTSQTGASLDCNVEDLVLDLAVEGASGSTGNTALVIGTNATNTSQMFLRLFLTGTINTQVTGNSKDFHYWPSGSILVSSQGTAVLGYRRHGDSTDRLRFEALTAGGRIQYGDGTTLDVNEYRSAANVLSTDDKYDPASLNLQLKAGAVVDGDIVGGAASGDVAFDTTNHRLYIRSGTTWRFVDFVQPFSRGGTLYDSNGIPNSALNIIVWRAPFACTVTNVRGYRVGGTGAEINARLNGSSNHLSAALSLTSADTWTDGGAVQNTAYAAGDKLEIMIVSTAGTVTQLAIQVDFTRP